MKKKVLVSAAAIVMLISLFANFTTYMSRKNTKINGGNEASFFRYGDEIILKVDGCLDWHDEKQQSKEFRQYWKIRATATKKGSTCTILDVWDHGSSIIIPDPEECTLSTIDEDAKTATIVYKDATLTINRDRSIWTTSDPNEKGGGELIKCWDRKINWYLW